MRAGSGGSHLGTCPLGLLVGVVAAAHHGAHGSVFETHGIGFLLELLEGVGVHVALDRQVGVAGREVLADGEHVDVVRAHVAQHLQHFFVGLAQAHHDAALGRDAGVQRLELFQQAQRKLVVAARACLLVQARRGFQVVVEHVGRGGLQNGQGFFVAATEVGHQHLNLGAGGVGADLRDAIGKVLGAAVAQVVAVHAGDDHVFELHARHGLRQLERLARVQWVGAAVAHVAKGAAARALVAHDHEGGGAVAEAFADVGAAGFLAHGGELGLAQDVFDLVEARAGAAGLDADPVGLLEHLALFHLHRDARELGMRFLLQGGVVVGGALRLADGLFGRSDHGVRRGFRGRGRWRACGPEGRRRLARAPTRRL